MSHPLVFNIKKGITDVYIGRPSKWGNPFVIGRDGTREEVIAKYAIWLNSRADLLRQIPTLRGLTLGCFCAPEPCHGDILAMLANPDMGAEK
jgi:hypothetical protein